MPKLVFLATDVALYGLIVAIAFYVWHALRTPTLRQTWRGVLHDPVAMSAAVVLLVFLARRGARFAAFPFVAAAGAGRRGRCASGVLDPHAVGARLAAREAARSAREVLLGPARHARLREGIDRRRRQVGPRLSATAVRRRAPQGSRRRVGERRGATLGRRGSPAAPSGSSCCGWSSQRCGRCGSRASVAASLSAIWRRNTEVPWRPMLLTAFGHRALRRVGRRAVAGLSRVRHRPDRQRRPVPGDEVDPHRGGDRLARHARHAAVRDRVRHPRRLLQGPGRRRDPVPVHDAVVDSVGAADRGVRPDDPGVRRQESADVRDRAAARRHPAVPAGGDPRAHRAGRRSRGCCAPKRSSSPSSTTCRPRARSACRTSTSCGATSCRT